MTLRALAVALLLGLSGCDLVQNPNVVDAELLRPLLPGEQDAIQAYLASLPEGAYKAYETPVGKFYVDDDKDAIKRAIAQNKYWDAHLLALYPQHVKLGSTVIDAGAHIGTHTVPLARLVGRKGRVYTFEPQRKIFRELVFNLRLNAIDNVVPLRYALGHTTGVVEMNPPDRANEGATTVGRGGDRVEMRTLDSFGFRNVSLIKIDVEQFEDFVLEGGQLTILRSKPAIVIEIMGGYFYDRAPPEIRARIEGTQARLKTLGYKVAQIHEYDYLAVPE